MTNPCVSLCRVINSGEWVLACLTHNGFVDRLQERCSECEQYVPGDGSVGLVQKIPVGDIVK